MAVLIVGTEKNITQLKSRVVAGRVSKANYDKLTEAIKAANPHVNLERLAPGTVLTIPDVPEVRIKDELSMDEISRRTLAQVSEQLSRDVTTAGAASTEEVKRASTARRDVARALDSNAVAKAVRRDKQVGAGIRAVKERIETEEAFEKERRALDKKAISQWSKSLQHLRSLVGE